MEIHKLQALKREFEQAGIQFVRENERGVGARIGAILARSRTDQNWIAIGPSNVDHDTQSVLEAVLEAVAQEGI